MGLFSKKNKTDKKWCVLYMYIKTTGKLHEIIDSMSDMTVMQQYNLRIHFTQTLFFREYKKYGAEKITSFYPDQWPSPVYNPASEDSTRTAKRLAGEFAALKLPELGGKAPEVEIRVLGDGDFAAACFEYGED